MANVGFVALRTNHFMQRAFLYGDLLFESMLGSKNGISHLNLHYNRLMRGAAVLKLETASMGYSQFEDICLKALAEFYLKHSHTIFCRVRFALYRNGKGLYLPLSHGTDYDIQVEPLPEHTAGKILRLGIYTEQNKAPGALSALKTGNALIYVMARIWAEENHLDDALIVNCKGEIIEASSSNIFWKADHNWYTPPLSAGCVAGIGRELFMQKHSVTEAACMANDLRLAAECILTNALYHERRFILEG